MRGLILALIVPVWLTGVAWAQEALSPAPDIPNTIRQQVEAFQAEDVEAAFQYASPSIQRLFGTSERFGLMVEQGYPMVWRPGALRFGDLREIGGALWQKVIVTDQAGVVHALDYRMELLEGRWRISAVQILPAPDLSV